MQALVLAAGKGTRMHSDLPKVLHPVLGVPILGHVLQTLKELGVTRPCVVIGSGADLVRSFLNTEKSTGFVPEAVLQKVQNGTGHAVMMAERFLGRRQDEILIWPGDMPLVRRETLETFIRYHREACAKASVLSSLQPNPAGYGRILRAGGRFYAIREELDATEIERRIQEVNTGIYLFNTAHLFRALRKIRPDNRKKELYLTDAIEILSGEEIPVAAFPLALPDEGQGINDRNDLANVMQAMSEREIQKHMASGVTFVAPDQTFVAKDVKIGKDTVIYPWTYLEKNVRIGERCEVGPFTKIRSGTVIGDDSVIGSFVEVTRSRLGKKVLAKHLTYLGDATIGDDTNIGAGTITANFDGKHKYKTKIGKKNLIGSNTVLVAPVTLGDAVKTGAGAIVKARTRAKKGTVLVGMPARPISKRKQRA